MRKILSILSILFFSLFLSFDYSYSECSYSSWVTLKDNLWECFNNSAFVWNNEDVIIWEWFDKQIQKWTTWIATFLWIMSVFGIVYGTVFMVTSAWEDEKINKWKTAIKWSVIWFIAILSASAIVNIVIKLVYTIW